MRSLRVTSRGFCLIGAALLLHGCKSRGDTVPPAPLPVAVADNLPEWEKNAASADLDKLNHIDQAWREALPEAGKGAGRRSLRAEGNLLQPKSGLLRPQPSPGSYMCRLIQLGSSTPRTRTRALAVSKLAFCYVGVDETNRLWLAKQTGPRRRQGYLWEDDVSNRLIFLGSLAAGASDTPAAYGTDPARNSAGIFERVGPLRYRLVTPWPSAAGYKLEVLELTPAPTQRDE